MNKQEFLMRLRKGLSHMPQEDIEERLTFYSEMIDDRMEEGLSEEDAVLAVGSVDDIISQLTADDSVFKTERTQKRRLKAWEIVLMVLGSPIWVSLLIAAFAVALSLYFSLWAIILSLWAVFSAFVACSLGGLFAGIVFIASNEVLSGIATVGAGTACAGMSVLLFFGCRAVTKYTLLLTKKSILIVRNRFLRKEAA